MEDDVPAHIDALVEMMDAVRRVLRPDGTVWLNVADSYSMPPGESGRLLGAVIE